MRYLPSVPLPEKAHIPGDSGTGPCSPDLFFPESPLFLPSSDWRQHASYLYGIDLFNHGFYWEAHEIWAEPYRASKGLDQEQSRFLQALIQMAAACMHMHSGKAKASMFTGQKALKKINAVSDSRPFFMGLDLKTLSDLLTRQLSGKAGFMDKPILNLDDNHQESRESDGVSQSKLEENRPIG